MYRKALKQLLLIILVCQLNGCAIFRVEKGNLPEIIGVATLKEIPIEQGRLFKVYMPGFGIRTGYLTSGLSLGWHESLIFCANKTITKEDVDCIADQGFSIGMDISDGGFILGVYRAFKVPLPEAGSVIQRIHYSQDWPEKTQIERRIIQ
jgi:hypothetical protein